MGAVLRIVDEQFSATPDRVQALELRLVSERVTAREILRRRVEAEVASANDRKQAHVHSAFRSLIVPEAGSTEAFLNRPRTLVRRPKPIDAEAEVTRAVVAFSANRFLMLLDDRQLEDLDAEITLRPESEVVFLYITPLKGG